MAWKKPKPGKPTKRDWQTTLLIASAVVFAGIVTAQVLTDFLQHGIR